MAKKFLLGIDVTNQRIQNVASASLDTDAPNWGQVKNWVYGLDWKQNARVASTTNVTVSSPGATIDNVTLASGDRVLLKNQTTGSENGIYVFNSSTTALTRAPDAVQGTLTANATLYVAEGQVNADTQYTLTTNDPITVGTTALTFVLIGTSGAGVSYTQGAGIVISGSSIAIDPAVVTRKFAQNIGDGSTTTIPVTHNLGTLDVQVAVVLVSTGEAQEPDILRTSANAISVTFASAPSSNQYRVVVQG